MAAAALAAPRGQGARRAIGPETQAGTDGPAAPSAEELIWVASAQGQGMAHVRDPERGSNEPVGTKRTRPSPSDPARPLCKWKQGQDKAYFKTRIFLWPGVEGCRRSGRRACKQCIQSLSRGLRMAVEETLHEAQKD